MSRRGRVLVCLHEPSMNGATVAVLRTLEPLEELGWEFAFWSPGEGEAAEVLRERGYRVESLERPVGSSLASLMAAPGPVRRLPATARYIAAFSRYARSVRPRVVHANSLYSFLEAVVARRLGLRTLLHLHDMCPRGRTAGVARAICRRGVHLSVAVSSACAHSYRVGSWEPLVMHGAVPVPAESARLRERPSPFRVGTMGVISTRKGSDLFVRAVELLTSSGDARDFEFHMVGAASEPLEARWGEELSRRAAELGIRHERRADGWAALRGWDAFALPSRRDPFPLAVLEAMALGLPVVGAAVDGVPEQIATGTGLLVPPENPEALAAAMRRVAGMTRDERAAIGRAARERVTARFALERLVTDTDELYRRVGRPA